MALLVVVLLLTPFNSAAYAQQGSESAIADLYWQITEIAETQGIDAAIAFFYSLPAEERSAVSDAILEVAPASETSTLEQIAPESLGLSATSAGGCWGWQTSRLYENAFGAYMFRYYHRTEWCGNGSRITSYSSYAWPEVYSIWWDFSSHIANGQVVSGGTCCYNLGTFSQGRFRGQVGDVGIQTRTPWIRHDVNANGGYSQSGGG